MTDRILYLLGVVGVGMAVTVGLRSLPFLLFAGRDRELPRWVERFGVFVSPVIIACLIFYSYAGLEWKTPWPYLAGLLTVGLQLAFRNPLVSIIAGTVLYMCVLSGCATTRSLEFDGAHPCVAITSNGVKFGNRLVMPQDVPELLESHHVPKDATIHILVEDDYTDRRAPWVFQHNILGRAGYRRTILVSKRRAESMAVERKQPAPPEKKPFRYKGANE